MPVSLGGMINEARILGGPSPPPLRPRGQALHMKLAYAAHLPGREPLMILPTPLCLQSPNSTPKPCQIQASQILSSHCVAVRERCVAKSSLNTPAPLSSTFHLNHISSMKAFLQCSVVVICYFLNIKTLCLKTGEFYFRGIIS